MRRVNQPERKKIVRKGIFFLLFLVLIWNVAVTGTGKERDKTFSLKTYLLSNLQEKVMETIMPFAAYQTGEHTGEEGSLVGRMVLQQQAPYFSYAITHQSASVIVEDEYFYRLLLEEQEGESDGREEAPERVIEDEGTDDLLAAMEAENAAAKKESDVSENAVVEEQEEEKDEEQQNEEEAVNLQQVTGTGFLRVLDKKQQYDWNLYTDTDSLVKEFYAVDSTTSAQAADISLESFLQKDLSIDKNTEGYQILIFHTHSQEDFADSVSGDKSTTIVGIGDLLTQILTEEYGYKVLHHTGEYDVEYRDDAYSKALPAIEQILSENPSIQVVLDLHRDEVAEGTKLVTDVQGRPTAKIMFFNGLSYTNQTGKIGYLENNNLSDNLAFSFQMQVACNEYFPGLTRRIYLKGYRYNMHLKERFLLVEMGAQTNTVEEIRNACDPLAQTLDMVLSGMVY